MNRLVSAAVAIGLVASGCSKPPPPLVVTLRPESPDGSNVRHTIIAVRSAERTLVLNMEFLTPAEFVDYRATHERR